MKQISLFFVGLFLSLSVFADSSRVDVEYLNECRGRIELRESSKGLHLQFRNVKRCQNLTVKTQYGTVLKQYAFNKGGKKGPYSPNYTLSRRMLNKLDRGQDLVLIISGSYKYGWQRYKARDEIRVVVGGHKKPKKKCGGNSDIIFGYGYTNSCKCALYFWGQFQYHVDELYCKLYQ